jgi:hypothetical protein
VKVNHQSDSSVGTSKSNDSVLNVRNIGKYGNRYCRSAWGRRAYNFIGKRCEIALVCRHCSPDGCKIEWVNKYENDHTPDGSRWTSLDTDGILATSPSTCDDCQLRPYGKKECWSEMKGNVWISERECKILKLKRRAIEKRRKGKGVPPPIHRQICGV